MAEEWATDHSENLAVKVKELYEEDAMKDITIVTGDQEPFQAHKVILAANSGYFKSMFTLDFVEKEEQEVKIDSIPGDTLMQLLKFCYTGELKLSDEEVLSVTEAAFYLQMEEAINLCFYFITSESTRSDVPTHFDVLYKAIIMADVHNYVEGFGLCLDTLVYWFMDIYKTELFLKSITCEIMCKLLERTDLTKERNSKETDTNEPNEDHVLEAVVGWLKYDWETRKVHTASLLKKVRLGTIKPEVLNKLIDTEIKGVQWYQEFLEQRDGDMAQAEPSFREMFCPRDSKHMLITFKPGLVHVLNNETRLTLHGFLYDLNSSRRSADGTIAWPMFLWSIPETVTSYVREPQHITVAVRNNCLYMCTGCSGHFFELNLTVSVGEWKELNFQHPSSQCAIVYLDGWLYAFDGFNPAINTGGEYTHRARRYHLLNQTSENLSEHDELDYISCPSAVTHKGHIIIYGHDMSNVEIADMTHNTHKLYVYNPSKNEWHVVYQERHIPHTQNTSLKVYSALVKHEDRCYRVIYESQEVRPDFVIDKPVVNELILDLESEPPTCQIGPPQDQSVICDNNNDIQYQGEFCINNELYLNIKHCILRTGHVMTADDISRRKWKSLYQNIDTDQVAFGPMIESGIWDVYDDHYPQYM